MRLTCRRRREQSGTGTPGAENDIAPARASSASRRVRREIVPSRCATVPAGLYLFSWAVSRVDLSLVTGGRTRAATLWLVLWGQSITRAVGAVWTAVKSRATRLCAKRQVIGLVSLIWVTGFRPTGDKAVNLLKCHAVSVFCTKADVFRDRVRPERCRRFAINRERAVEWPQRGAEGAKR